MEYILLPKGGTRQLQTLARSAYSASCSSLDRSGTKNTGASISSILRHCPSPSCRMRRPFAGSCDKTYPNLSCCTKVPFWDTPQPKIRKMSVHCCDRMDYDLSQTCDFHGSRQDCPDALIDVHEGRYALIVHDGGSSSIQIAFCPWCGSCLQVDELPET